MAEYIYPAVFHHNDDNSYTVTFPDLIGCISEGKSMAEAMRMAQSALTQWIGYLIDTQTELPPTSALKSIETSEDEFANLVCATIRDQRAVRRTVSIPKWMDDLASEAGLSLSRILQDALSDRLQTGSK